MDRLLRTRIPVLWSFPLDLLFVVLFVVIGRRSHENGYALPDLLLAVLPFVIGLVTGWAVIRWLSGAWPQRVLHGITLAVVTVAVGMIVRVLMGQSVGNGIVGLLAFTGVALAFLILFLVFWRAIVAYLLPAPRVPSRRAASD